MHPTQEELFEAFFDGLEPKRASQVHEHLQSCADCRQVIEDYQTIKLLAQATAAPSPKVLQTIRGRARDSTTKPREKVFWAYRSWKTAGAIMIVLLAAGIALFYRDQRVQPTPTPPETIAVAPSVTVLPRISPPLMGVDEGRGNQINEKKPSIQKADFDYAEVAEPVRDIPSVPWGVENRLAAGAPALKKEAAKPPFLAMAAELESKGSYREAEAIYRTAWQTVSSSREKQTILYRWALCLEKMGEKGKALKRLEALEKMNPAYPGLAETMTRIKK